MLILVSFEPKVRQAATAHLVRDKDRGSSVFAVKKCTSSESPPFAPAFAPLEVGPPDV